MSLLRTHTNKNLYCLHRIPSHQLIRRFSTELPRPPPKTQPAPVTFSDSSRPRPYHAKHPPIRDLPLEKPKWPIFLTAAVLGIASWTAFMLVATNQEKLSSSVFRSIVRALRADPQLKDILGDAIRPQPEWYLNGDPLVNGYIGQLQGNIDVSFRVKGSEGSGTVYFTSIRKEKGVPFQVLRFRVICDDGRIVNVADSEENTS